MKMYSRPKPPLEGIKLKGNTLSLDVTEAKRVLLFTENIDKLPGFNEYTKDSRVKTGFGIGVNGVDDCGVGTLRVLNPESDNVYLAKTDYSGKTRVMGSGFLQQNSLMTVDKTNHLATIQDIAIINDATSNNSVVIDDGSSATGWSIIGTTGTITVENGRIKVTGLTDANGRLVISKTITANWSAYNFISVVAEANNDGTYFLVSSSESIATYKYWQGSRYTAAATSTRFVYPIACNTAGSTGALPTIVTGTTDLSNVKVIRFGIASASPGIEKTFYLDEIRADVGKWVYVECNIPDKMYGYGDDVRVEGFTYTSGAYQVNKVFGSYGADGKLDGQDGYQYYLDGTMAQNMYNTTSIWTQSANIAYKRGKRSESKTKGIYFLTDNTAPSTITYSANYGTQNRFAFGFLMPPSDGDRTHINKIRLRLEISYDDMNEQFVQDYSLTQRQIPILGAVRKYSDNIYFPGIINNRLQFTLDNEFISPTQFMFMFDINIVNNSNLYHGLWFDAARGAENRILVGGAATPSILFQGSTANNSGISMSKTNAFSYGTRAKIAIVYTGEKIQFLVNGSKIHEVSATGALSNSIKTAWIGQGYASDYPIKGNVYLVAYSNTYSSGVLDDFFAGKNIRGRTNFYLAPSNNKIGYTTHIFDGSTNAVYGIGNITKPIICTYDTVAQVVKYYIINKKPTGMQYSYDENGVISNVTFTLQNNSMMYTGYLSVTDFTTDTNSDGIPDFVDQLKIVLDRYKFRYY